MTVFGVFPHEKMIYLVTMGVLWKNRHYSVFHCKYCNSLFGYYMHIMQIKAIWVFPNEKMVYLVTMSVS